MFFYLSPHGGMQCGRDFPDPRTICQNDDMLCTGGDLSPECLLTAYARGIFPWFSFRDFDMPVWHCPMRRFVLFPDEIHISHSMRTFINNKVIGRQEYRVTFNEDFEGIISLCSHVDGRLQADGAWLGKSMIEAYTALHHMGHAMSVEVRDGKNVIVGGLYGVTLNQCFMGESMCSQVPNASKLALVALCRFMRDNGWKMIDCQFETDHLRAMGGRFITYDEYMRLLTSGNVPLDQNG